MAALLFFITSFLYISFVNSVVIKENFEKFVSLDGYRCHNENVIFEPIKKVTLLDCARACSSLQVCSGLFYQKNTLMCVICSSQCNISASDDVLTGSVFYKRKLCPSDNSDWIALPKGCSRINVQRQVVSHTEAETFCESVDAHLFKVDEKWKMDFIVELLKNCKGLSDAEYWLDGTNAGALNYNATDAWRFHDGNVVSMDKYYWASHAPNSPETQHCFRIVNGLFDDTNCNFRYSFICEN